MIRAGPEPSDSARASSGKRQRPVGIAVESKAYARAGDQNDRIASADRSASPPAQPVQQSGAGAACGRLVERRRGVDVDGADSRPSGVAALPDPVGNGRIGFTRSYGLGRPPLEHVPDRLATFATGASIIRSTTSSPVRSGDDTITKAPPPAHAVREPGHVSPARSMTATASASRQWLQDRGDNRRRPHEQRDRPDDVPGHLRLGTNVDA